MNALSSLSFATFVGSFVRSSFGCGLSCERDCRCSCLFFVLYSSFPCFVLTRCWLLLSLAHQQVHAPVKERCHDSAKFSTRQLLQDNDCEINQIRIQKAGSDLHPKYPPFSHENQDPAKDERKNRHSAWLVRVFRFPTSCCLAAISDSISRNNSLGRC